MARLTLKLHGEEVSRLTLEEGVEYVAGRAQDANIQLAAEKGISRHHLKFYQRDGVWICESLSKFMLLQKSGESLEYLELPEPTMFSVPPYEFHFDPSSSAASTSANEEENPSPKSENLPTFYQPKAGPTSHLPGQPNGDTNGGVRANNEATMAGLAANLVPYIRISFPNTADDEVLKLEGHLWAAGRDTNCEIPIDSPHVSRKHFELARTQEGFYVTDLGSSNGTKINGQRIPPHEPTPIESGDEIAIKSVQLVFEIRDTNFANRVDLLPVPAFEPMFGGNAPVPWSPGSGYDEVTVLRSSSDFNQAPVPWQELRPQHLKDPANRKRFIRLAMMALIPLMIIGFLLPSKDKNNPKRDPDSNKGNTSASFDKLTPEQRSVIKDSFNLARNLYVQGKYELCLTELAKVHELTPLYENSKELESFCVQGKELVQRQRDLDRKERERQAIENQIGGYVETCKSKLTSDATVDETRQCLAEAIELDPEHHLIVEMIHGAQMHEEERKFLAQQRAAEGKKVAQGTAAYNKAKALYKNGMLHKAVLEYEHFIATPYPHIEDVKSTARREVASIKVEIKRKVDSLLDNCKSLGAKGQFKEAYKACERASEEDPDNATAKEIRARMVNELKRELKGIYEDSVLEESLGNVDSAKEKWKKIVKDDLDKGEYALKAKSKLQKYGWIP